MASLRSVLLVAMTALASTACGSPPTPPIVSGPASAPTSVPGPVTPGPLPGTYPDHDTPFASASASLRTLWGGFGLTVIPSKHLFDDMPTPPAVDNQTHGAVSDADAAQMAIAFNREGALERWADEHKQYGFRFHLFATALNSGPEAQALTRGDAVHAPPCLFFYPKMTLRLVDHGLVAFLAKQHMATNAAVYFQTVSAAEPCTVTATDPDGKVSTIDTVPAGVVSLFAGSVVTDAVLGQFWHTDGATLCPTAGLAARYCPD